MFTHYHVCESTLTVQTASLFAFHHGAKCAVDFLFGFMYALEACSLQELGMLQGVCCMGKIQIANHRPA